MSVSMERSFARVGGRKSSPPGNDTTRRARTPRGVHFRSLRVLVVWSLKTFFAMATGGSESESDAQREIRLASEAGLAASAAGGTTVGGQRAGATSAPPRSREPSLLPSTRRSAPSSGQQRSTSFQPVLAPPPAGLPVFAPPPAGLRQPAAPVAFDVRGLTVGDLHNLSQIIARQEVLSKESAQTASQSQRMLLETQAMQQVDQEFRGIFQLTSPDATATSQLETIKTIAERLKEATTQLTILTQGDAEDASGDGRDRARAALTALQEGKNGLTILATALTRAHDLGHRFAVHSAAKVMAAELEDHHRGYAAAFQSVWSKQEEEVDRRRLPARQQQRRRRRSGSPDSPPPHKRSPTPHPQQQQRGRGRGRGGRGGGGGGYQGHQPTAAPGVLGPPPSTAPT